MRCTPPLLLLLLALVAPAPAAAGGRVLELRDDGSVVARHDRFLPPPDARPARPPRTSRLLARRRSVPQVLTGLRDAGTITPEQRDAWDATYRRAKALADRLTGARRQNLRSVVLAARELAASGRLTPARAPLLFLTLERNRRWWASGPLLPFGRRVTFEGSELIWQSYPGDGIHVQWLGTMGRANQLFQAGAAYNGKLRALLAEMLPLAGERAGGRAFESFFAFAGGQPPWVSAMTQATAAQAIARAAGRLKDPALIDVARTHLAVFGTAPPEGVRQGDHFLMYSSVPSLRILNGWVQALNGIWDFAAAANDEGARQLFAAGEAALRAELPAFDTGAWSLYRAGKEADLGYHVLQRDFLRGLCKRMGDAGLDAQLYCDQAEIFTIYLGQPPVLRLDLRPLRARRRGYVRFTLDKVSSVSVRLVRNGRTVLSRTDRRERGRQRIGLRPSRADDLRVVVRAVDLAGNASVARGVVTVRRR